MTAERTPSFFILVPGPWRTADELCRVLEGDASLEGLEVEVEVVEDRELASGFEWGRHGPLPKDLLARVNRCSRAALIEVSGRLDEQASHVAALGRTLRDAGGVAVRMEASGAASPWQPWLERLESGIPFRIYESAVLIVKDEGDLRFTCGMHHFDLPEAQVAMPDSQNAQTWLDAFCLFQLAEQPGLASGHTFRPDLDSQRRVLERWPDHRHHRDDGRYNPFGVWRFLEPGMSGVQSGKLVPTLIPSLVAVLTAAEEKAGRPLEQQEVEAILAESAAVAMDPRDVLSLERSRGYADIEPELAWEQWQIARREEPSW